MQLYNTWTREIQEFEPIEDKKAGIYTCGPTVYREIHIGNFRTYITSDVLFRTLVFQGYSVTSVMNITDVGHMRYAKGKQIDPIMVEAAQKKITPLELSQHYTKLFITDAKKLNIIPPTVMPKATENVPEMITIIKILLERGYAYEASGNVYFDVDKFRGYGKLSGNTLDKMDQLLEAVRISVETDKKDSADFALWKRAPKDSVMRWDSPWGKGVPGWHIECSAMSIKYLGDTFDIHAGGEDLIFPHHEDEIAQSEAASGRHFVNYWVHSSFLLVENEKMSRSRGNIYTLGDIEQKGFHPLAFRYLTFQTHYRSKMNFTWESLEGAETALKKLYEIAASLPEPGISNINLERKFLDAVTHDLDMPKAISILWEALHAKIPKAALAATLYAMDEILGLSIRQYGKELHSIPDEIRKMAADRNKLRKMGRFHLADQLRAKIEKKGYIIRDTKNGVRVTKKI